MVMRGFVGAVILIVALAACAATPGAQGPAAEPELAEVPSAPAVSWQGHQLREVTSLAALPAAIRKAIQADASGNDGIAERGQPFNVTDVVIGDKPMRRFITAGHAGDLWLVALEQGGIAHYVSVAQISGGAERKGWFVDCCPTTLAEVVRQISAKPPDVVLPLKP